MNRKLAHPFALLALGAASLPLEAMEIEQAWARATPPGATLSAAFLTIRDDLGGGDRLLGATTPAAGRVELHESIMDGEMMRMRPLPDGIEIPAGGEVSLAPGGMHLMLLDLPAPLLAGESVPLTLQFDQAGAQTVELTIRAPGEGEHGGHEHHHH
ncbi:MAG: copper chaperone PCu(A)C [Lysobacterales bacterium]